MNLNDPNYNYTRHPADLYFITMTDFDERTGKNVEVDPKVHSSKGGEVLIFTTTLPPHQVAFARFAPKSAVEKIEAGETEVNLGPYVSPNRNELLSGIFWTDSGTPSEAAIGLIHGFEDAMLDGNTPQNRLEQAIEVVADQMLGGA